jgi:hypothetical protein
MGIVCISSFVALKGAVVLGTAFGFWFVRKKITLWWDKLST